MDKATEMLLNQISQKIDDKADIQTKELRMAIKGMRHYVDASGEVLSGKMDEVIKQNEVRNGRMEILEKQTSWWRFFQRNPWLTVSASLIFLVGILVLAGIDIDGEKLAQIFKHLKFW